MFVVRSLDNTTSALYVKVSDFLFDYEAAIKKAARGLEQQGVVAGHRQALNLLAKVAGYRDWRELKLELDQLLLAAENGTGTDFEIDFLPKFDGRSKGSRLSALFPLLKLDHRHRTEASQQIKNNLHSVGSQIAAFSNLPIEPVLNGIAASYNATSWGDFSSYTIIGSDEPFCLFHINYRGFGPRFVFTEKSYLLLDQWTDSIYEGETSLTDLSKFLTENPGFIQGHWLLADILGEYKEGYAQQESFKYKFKAMNAFCSLMPNTWDGRLSYEDGQNKHFAGAIQEYSRMALMLKEPSAALTATRLLGGVFDENIVNLELLGDLAHTLLQRSKGKKVLPLRRIHSIDPRRHFIKCLEYYLRDDFAAAQKHIYVGLALLPRISFCVVGPREAKKFMEKLKPFDTLRYWGHSELSEDLLILMRKYRPKIFQQLNMRQKELLLWFRETHSIFEDSEGDAVDEVRQIEKRYDSFVSKLK